MITSALLRPCFPLLFFVVALAAACSGQNEEALLSLRPRLRLKKRPPSNRLRHTMPCHPPCASRWIIRSPVTSTNW